MISKNHIWTRWLWASNCWLLDQLTNFDLTQLRSDPGPPCNSGEQWTDTSRVHRVQQSGTPTKRTKLQKIEEPDMFRRIGNLTPEISKNLTAGKLKKIRSKNSFDNSGHCLFPNLVVEYKMSFLVTGRRQYLRTTKLLLQAPTEVPCRPLKHTSARQW